jgi:uncharacterized membrane protein YciS (DUF1049 family)
MQILRFTSRYFLSNVHYQLYTVVACLLSMSFVVIRLILYSLS